MNSRLLVLNVMISGPLEQALDQHLVLGLQDLDLKMNWSGSMIENMQIAEARQFASAIAERGLAVQCLSSCTGELSGQETAAALNTQDEQVAQLCRLVPILKPRYVRLIVPRGEAAIVSDEAVLRRYQQWIDQLRAAGTEVVMENEIGGSIGRDPHLIDDFFNQLQHAQYIWDIANQWQEGLFPSLADYELLKKHIAVLHVKGGRWDNPEQKTYAWKSQLANSDWPVQDICRAALQDGIENICINPPHGVTPDGWAYDLSNDINFMKNIMELSHV